MLIELRNPSSRFIVKILARPATTKSDNIVLEWTLAVRLHALDRASCCWDRPDLKVLKNCGA